MTDEDVLNQHQRAIEVATVALSQAFGGVNDIGSDLYRKVAESVISSYLTKMGAEITAASTDRYNVRQDENGNWTSDFWTVNLARFSNPAA